MVADVLGHEVRGINRMLVSSFDEIRLSDISPGEEDFVEDRGAIAIAIGFSPLKFNSCASDSRDRGAAAGTPPW